METEAKIFWMPFNCIRKESVRNKYPDPHLPWEKKPFEKETSEPYILF